MEKKIGRPKTETKLVSFKMAVDTYNMVKEDSEKYGVSFGAYLAMIASQKHMETVAMRVVANVTPEQLQQLMNDQGGKK